MRIDPVDVITDTLVATPLRFAAAVVVIIGTASSRKIIDLWEVSTWTVGPYLFPFPFTLIDAGLCGDYLIPVTLTSALIVLWHLWKYVSGNGSHLDLATMAWFTYIAYLYHNRSPNRTEVALCAIGFGLGIWWLKRSRNH